MLQAALNGDREHPAAPRTPGAIAAEARAAVDAGATSVHVHVFDAVGRQTLDAGPTAMTLAAIRAAAPGTEISLSTSAAIEPDPHRRAALIADWAELPDLVTANLGEPGIDALAEHLLARGVGIEAGLLCVDDAERLLVSRFAPRCTRALVEPLDGDPDMAVKHAAAIEDVLAVARVDLPQIHHGDGIASWAVNRRAVARRHGIRTGLEDTPVLPDGRTARDNAELVAAAVALQRG